MQMQSDLPTLYSLVHIFMKNGVYSALAAHIWISLASLSRCGSELYQLKHHGAVKRSFFPWRHFDRRKPKRSNAEGQRRGTVSVTGIHPKASGFTRIGERGEGKKVRYMAGVNFQGGHCQCKERQGREEHQWEVRKAWNKHGELAR